MKELNEKELKETVGGGLSGWFIAGIVAIAAFTVGVLDGLSRPIKCNY